MIPVKKNPIQTAGKVGFFLVEVDEIPGPSGSACQASLISAWRVGPWLRWYSPGGKTRLAFPCSFQTAHSIRKGTRIALPYQPFFCFNTLQRFMPHVPVGRTASCRIVPKWAAAAAQRPSRRCIRNGPKFRHRVSLKCSDIDPYLLSTKRRGGLEPGG